MRLLLLPLLLALSVALGTGCATTNEPAASNPNFTKAEARAALPKKIVLLPAQVRVSEISAGGVIEKVEAWTDQAKSNIDAALRESVAKAGGFELVAFPSATQLSAEDRQAIDQHLALYGIVALEAWTHSRSQDPAWAHKKTNFDYTLGPGLKFLKDQTGADAAMVLICEDYISSGGRKAMMLFATVLAAAAGAVVMPTGAPSFVSGGVVSLDDGNIQWFNYSLEQGSADLRNSADAKRMVSNIMRVYPGFQQK
jgi:hypothetical protein